MSESQARKMKVSATEAAREIARHGLEFADFQADCGTKEMYKGSVVLDWLGY